MTLTANFTRIQHTLTLYAGLGGSVNDGVNGLYDEGTVVGIVATPDSGYVFSGWTVDLGAPANVADTGASSTDVTMDEDMTLTANFRLTDIITFAELEGWNNAGCNPGFGHPHLPYLYTESEPDPEPYEIEPDIAWLTITNPNLKSVHFFVNIAADDSPIVTYKYTTNTIINETDTKIWSSSSTVGTLTGPVNGEYVFSSTCMEIPGTPSQSDYPHHFYINIDVNGINSYMVHLW